MIMFDLEKHQKGVRGSKESGSVDEMWGCIAPKGHFTLKRGCAKENEGSP